MLSGTRMPPPLPRCAGRGTHQVISVLACSPDRRSGHCWTRYPGSPNGSLSPRAEGDPMYSPGTLSHWHRGQLIA